MTSLSTPAWRAKAYQLLLRQMFRFPAERIHGSIHKALYTAQALPLARFLLRSQFSVNDERLTQTLAGITFPRPLGVAAGFDKNGKLTQILPDLGFGYTEVGTVTSLYQPGNPAPRLFRLPQDRAIINRMGFNNDGSLELSNHLRKIKKKGASSAPVGVNIGKGKRIAPECAADDYHRNTRIVNDVADYIALNVSSPNTPGLRDLQAVESLRLILDEVKKETTKPIFLKIAPDLSDDDIDAITDLAIEKGIEGMITTNTTISREGLSTSSHTLADIGAGGLSGAPLADRAQEVLIRVAQRSQGKLILIAVGGIETPQQAWERITAGASLLQGYTGFIYHGPDWTKNIHRGLLHQLEVHGLKNISEAVGSQLPWKD